MISVPWERCHYPSLGHGPTYWPEKAGSTSRSIQKKMGDENTIEMLLLEEGRLDLVLQKFKWPIIGVIFSSYKSSSTGSQPFSVFA